MPTAARTRPWHAWLLGPYASSSAARWPRSRFAGNRARTLGARIYTASEALPVAPRAELASARGSASAFDEKTARNFLAIIHRECALKWLKQSV